MLTFAPSKEHLIAFSAILVVSSVWQKLVLRAVPEPYLDEVFHIVQAQRYCHGDFSWDPKITTPPGLYLVSLVLYKLGWGCEVSSLRILNQASVCLLTGLASIVLQQLRTPKSVSESKTRDVQTNSIAPWLEAHSAFNIALFPPLFFFSALYYTDVLSTLLVLQSYSVFLTRTKGAWSTWDFLVTVCIGVAALMFRQTNIFWVAVFPAGLAVIESFDNLTSGPTTIENHETYQDVLQKSWDQGKIYDLLVADASIIDYLILPLSIIAAICRRPLRIALVLLPYIFLMGLFAGFVAWNGGVVLGDKSNHVATIHAPQMLYIWPYMAFFSLPLLIPSLIDPLVHRLPRNRLKTFLQDYLVGYARWPRPDIITLIGFTLFGFAAVHYNTIVHPFTLADNRHYVFYVFRILRRHPAIKYVAVPLYSLCAWACLRALLASPLGGHKSSQGKKDFTNASQGASRSGPRTSFVIVWLLTSALSLVTAPLVEPRYFIIPWLIWRLHVPNVSTTASISEGNTRKYDARLFLETIWYLGINAATGYMFLRRGFAWPNEPGKVQRFLW